MIGSCIENNTADLIDIFHTRYSLLPIHYSTICSLSTHIYLLVIFHITSRSPEPLENI